VNERFESSVRSAGDLAGVFEHDGDTGYFYLYEPGGAGGQAIVGYLLVMSGARSVEVGAVEVRWDADEQVVGLFIDGELWAAFDGSTRAGYAGDYAARVGPELPARMRSALRGR
jgi:hypothetical protein